MQPMCTHAAIVRDRPVFEGGIATYADCDVDKGAQEHCLQCPSHSEYCQKGERHCEHSKQYLMIHDSPYEALVLRKCTDDSMPLQKVQNTTMHDSRAVASCTRFAVGASLSVHLVQAVSRFVSRHSHGMHMSSFTREACVMARSPSEPPASCASHWDS